MSRFIENVQAQLTGRVKAAPPERLTVGVRAIEPFATDIRTLQEYRIGVAWEAKMFIAPKDVDQALTNVVAELRHAVYGDFKNRVLMLQRAILEEERDKALMHCRDLIREIYGNPI